MGISHIALAVHDIGATHRFYTDVMGFSLVKTEVVPKGEGFARHVFYSTGSETDQLMAFWDLAADPTAGEFGTDISRDLGLDVMVNHFAFTAESLADLEAHKQRWLDHGRTVMQIDHGWINSIYTEDPDGNVVEFAIVVAPFTDDDAFEALAALEATTPVPGSTAPEITFFEPQVEEAVADADADSDSNR